MWCATYGINHITMSEIGDNKEQGVPKNPKVTKKLISATAYMLSAKAVCIAEDCVSISSDFARPELKMEDQRRELKNQFIRYHYNPVADKYTGKGGASNNDDFIVAFMMPLHWSTVFRQDQAPQYIVWKEQTERCMRTKIIW